jgi:hypothetical protein
VLHTNYNKVKVRSCKSSGVRSNPLQKGIRWLEGRGHSVESEHTSSQHDSRCILSPKTQKECRERKERLGLRRHDMI